MTFTVTYRDRTGAKREEAIEAADRTACVAVCRARGISPLAIREGANGRKGVKGANGDKGSKGLNGPKDVKGDSRSPRRHSPFSILHFTFAIAAVAAIALAWWWLSTREETRPSEALPAKPNAVKEVKPASRAKSAGKSAVSPMPGAKAHKPPIMPQPVVQTNAPATNNVVHIVPPIDPNDPDVALRSRTSQEIGSLLSITPGEPVPPFPYAFILEDDAKKQGETASNGNDMFLESLRKTKIQIKETDSDAVAKHKEAIVTAQLDLLDGIKEGLSVNDTIRAAYELRVRAYEYRTELVSSLREWAKENPTREEFGKGLAEINEKLKENGIRTIPAGEVVPELEEDDK